MKMGFDVPTFKKQKYFNVLKHTKRCPGFEARLQLSLIIFAKGLLFGIGRGLHSTLKLWDKFLKNLVLTYGNG